MNITYNSRPPLQRHPLPHAVPHVQVDIDDPELAHGAILRLPGVGLVVGAALDALQLQDHLAPGIDDQATAVALRALCAVLTCCISLKSRR